jgi:hypothetical protein
VGEWVSDKMPHGVAFVGDGLAAADGATNTVVFAEEASGKVVGSVETDKSPTALGWHNPDSLLVEPNTGLLIGVNKDSGALALLDVRKHVLVGAIQVGGTADVERNCQSRQVTTSTALNYSSGEGSRSPQAPSPGPLQRKQCGLWPQFA